MSRSPQEATIEALIAASGYPLSVLIVGIGKADFSNMKVFDSTDGVSEWKRVGWGRGYV